MRQEVIADFDNIAWRYDLLTGLNPGYGTHLKWSAARLHLGPSARILDLCCGTGISTQALVETYPDAAEIVGLDASAGMLEQARQRFARNPERSGAARGHSNNPERSGAARGHSAGGRTIRWVQGDAMDPAAALGPEPFDGILMAYGIRNVPDADVSLRNILALLRPGGTLCIHEYSVADSLWAKTIWNTVAATVIGPMGRIATGNGRMWTYLRESVNRFDGVKALEARLAQAGFVDVRTLPMNGWQRGVVHSFVARRGHA